MKKKTGIAANKTAFDLMVGTFELKMNEPAKKEVWFAFKELTSDAGKVDMLASGEAIFNTCVIEYDSEIMDNPRLFMAVCLELASKYVVAEDVEIKKKVKS